MMLCFVTLEIPYAEVISLQVILWSSFTLAATAPTISTVLLVFLGAEKALVVNVFASFYLDMT